jgi:hypothetical protein
VSEPGRVIASVAVAVLVVSLAVEGGGAGRGVGALTGDGLVLALAALVGWERWRSARRQRAGL